MNLPVDEELDRGVGNTNAVEDILEVVRNETVTRPLREEGNSDNDAHTPAVAGCFDKLEPPSPLLDLLFGDGSADLVEFESDKRIFGVAVSVVVSQSFQCLFFSAVVIMR